MSATLMDEVSSRPNAPELRLRLSRALEAEGSIDESFVQAIMALERVNVARSFPLSAVLDCYEQVACIALKKNYRFLAEIIATSGLIKGGANAKLYLRLAQAYTAQNRFEEASKMCANALRINANLTEAHKLRASLKVAMGQSSGPLGARFEQIASHFDR